MAFIEVFTDINPVRGRLRSGPRLYSAMWCVANFIYIRLY